MTPGRNDPCPCGSGQTYKKCHLAADKAEAAKRAAPKTPELPDGRAMESVLADFTRSYDSNAGQNQRPVEAAQDIMYDAWEMRDPQRRVELARKAIEISPDCADAYVLLAQETARSLSEAKMLYETAVAAGERALGPKMFKRAAGHFWGLLETRPYMRARHGLAQCLCDLGDLDGAANHDAEMLRLNPDDNQGVRYQLAAVLLEAGRDDELATLLDQFHDDGAAAWAYAAALLAFRRDGDVAKSRALLSEAISANGIRARLPARTKEDAPAPPRVRRVRRRERSDQRGGGIRTRLELDCGRTGLAQDRTRRREASAAKDEVRREAEEDLTMGRRT